MWTAVAAAVAAWWRWRQKKHEAETQLALKEIDSGIRGGDPMLRRLSFLAAVAPLGLTVYDPELAGLFFDRLGGLPSWYVELLMVMFVSIWGLSVAREVLPSMVERLLKAWRNGRH